MRANPLPERLAVAGKYLNMLIEVWTDVVCPFCYVGKRELASALEDFAYADEVEVVFKSFELDQSAAIEGEEVTEHLMRKYGLSPAQVAAQNEQLAARAAEAGLTFNWRQARSANTLDAHRLIKLAGTQGLADQATDLLMKAFFTDGQVVSDRDVLVGIGAELGLDGDRVEQLLDRVEFAEEVHADQAEAGRYGITGVPFFLFEGQWAVSGAQPAELFLDALEQVWAETHQAQFITMGEGSGGSCGCGGCGCGS